MPTSWQCYSCQQLSYVCAAEQIRILEESGQLPLAYVAAATHGFEEDAARLKEVRPSALGTEPCREYLSTVYLQCAVAAVQCICHKGLTAEHVVQRVRPQLLRAE